MPSCSLVLADVGEEADEDLQDQVVIDVEQVGDIGGHRVGDDDVEAHPVDRAHPGGDDRMGGLEGRIGGLDRLELLEDGEEPAVVRLAPVTAGAFALLDDRPRSPGWRSPHR